MRRVLILCMVFMLACGVVAAQERYLLIGETDYNKVYLDTQTIKYNRNPSGNIVFMNYDVWTKSVHLKSKRISYTIDHVILDVKNRAVMQVSYHDFDSTNLLLDEGEYKERKWEKIIPGTNPEALLNAVAKYAADHHAEIIKRQ